MGREKADAAMMLRHKASLVFLGLLLPFLVLSGIVCHSAALPQARQLLWLGLALTACGGLLALLFTLLLERLLLRRIRALEAGLCQIAGARDFSLRLPVDGCDEIARLGVQANAVLDRLLEARREQQLSENRYRTLFQEMMDAFALHEVVVGADGRPTDCRLVEVNPACERLFGRPAAQLLGRTLREAVPGIDPFWIETLGEVALSGVPAHVQHSAQALDRHLEVSAFAPKIGQVAAILRDITERKVAENERLALAARIQQTQRLESLSVLAGGIAHDFNNLLVGILGNADLALDDLPPDAPVRDYLRGIEDSAKQAADLCRQMMAYAGRSRLSMGPVDLGRLVGDMTRLLEISVQKGVVLNYHLLPDLPAIHADGLQLRQAIINLVTNASEAIGGHSGIVRVTTGVMHCDRACLAGTFIDDNLAEGLYAFIEVADTGCGISEEALPHLFDPFYSTKFVGRGLGLASVLGSVRAHKGAIKVETALRRGSTFRLLFPVAESLPVGACGAAVEPRGWMGSGTILLVDDDETVRAVARRILLKAGFEVVTAGDGHEALLQFMEREDEITAVILDLTMPRMGGEEALRRLRALNKTVPVLISSGYDEEDIRGRFVSGEVNGFVQKPYRVQDMLARVRAAMQPASASPGAAAG